MGGSSELDKVDWYHQIELPDGTRTPGWVPHWFTNEKTRVYPDSLAGLRVIDVGSQEGFLAFEAEKRDADEVIALDQGEKDGFEVARELLDSNVEHWESDVFDVDPAETFDMVSCYSVFYYIDDPSRLLDKLASMSEDILCFGTFVIPSLTNRSSCWDSNSSERPWWPNLMKIYRSFNKCYPTARWIDEELETRGFEITEQHSFLTYRHVQLLGLDINSYPAPHRLFPACPYYSVQAKRVD